jgi:hypothetical protein
MIPSSLEQGEGCHDLSEHLACRCNMSDLSVRLRQAGIGINRCILVYAIIDESPVPITDQTMFLIEEVMTRICRPGFVLRIG